MGVVVYTRTYAAGELDVKGDRRDHGRLHLPLARPPAYHYTFAHTDRVTASMSDLFLPLQPQYCKECRRRWRKRTQFYKRRRQAVPVALDAVNQKLIQLPGVPPHMLDPQTCTRIGHCRVSHETCHENFGPLKILVRGTKICGEMVPPDRLFRKFWSISGEMVRPLFRFKVHYSGAVKLYAVLLEIK